MKNELNCFISQVVQVSPSMKIFRVVPDGWELPDFEAGQFVALYLPGSATRSVDSTDEFKESEPDKLIKRAYSIASSSKNKEFIEFYITLVRSGSLTPRLFDLKIGDRIGMGSKFVGMFTLNEVPEDKNVILIATGTGVAPYMSMLRSDALSKNRKITVIHGASNSWDLGYRSELTLLESITDKLKYIPTIIEPDKEPTKWSGYTQFIQDLWADGIIEKVSGYKPTPENSNIFICGNPNMINTMIDSLGKEGFTEHSKKSPGQIHVEKF
ncbi:MAG: ferredoxin--NADP reductase [Bacteroidales bacterium]|nr:ferredoxin--NADP reductase [Bacteroidales bacterium]MBN2755571.1 ferredoxin--NADP reductase [Bacteroidales bacterium]